MSANPVHVDAQTDIRGILDAASEHPLILERDGRLFQVSRIEEPDEDLAGYDPEALRQALRDCAGILTEEQADAIKTQIYAAREAGTRPQSRP